MIWLSFFKQYWKAIAIAAIIAVVYIRFQIITNERDDALQTIANMQQEAIKQNARVSLLNEQGKRATDALQASHVADIQHIGALYGKQINNDKKSIDNYRNQLASKLREQASNRDSGLPNNDTNQSTNSNGDTTDTRQSEDSDTDYRMMYLGAQEYIKTLEQAGAVCATDYNTCKQYVDEEQKRIGVTK